MEHFWGRRKPVSYTHLREQLSRRDQALPAPKISVNSQITDFYDFTPDDIVLEGYEHLGKLAMTVAV